MRRPAGSQPDLFGVPTKPATGTRGKKYEPKAKDPTAYALKSEAAPLIREHLWLGNVPPPPPHPSDKPWSMARDLHIWQHLVDAGYTPELLNGAITTVRGIMTNGNGERPLTMRVFWWKGATPLVEQAIGEFCKREIEEGSKQGRLPPTVRDIMRRMIG